MPRKPRAVDVVVKAVCDRFGSKPSRVLSPTRGTPVDATVRQIAMHVYRSLPNQSFSSVGRAFDRDRTTVRHNVQVVDTLTGNAVFATALNEVMAEVRVKLK